jgi:hypothetical protein
MVLTMYSLTYLYLIIDQNKYVQLKKQCCDIRLGIRNTSVPLITKHAAFKLNIKLKKFAYDLVIAIV